MKRDRRRGVAYIEMAFAMLVLVPLLLGLIGLGLSMQLQLQTVQLARDAGHMYARVYQPNVAFNTTGNKQILADIGAPLGMSSTDGSGNAVVILSRIMYVDDGVCQANGLWASGAPNGCTNWKKWVFTNYLVFGNISVRPGNLGSPLTSGPTGVTVDTKGNISTNDQLKQAGAQATFSGANPYYDAVAAGLPSGQVIYVAEAAAKGFRMPPYSSGTNTYAASLF